MGFVEAEYDAEGAGAVCGFLLLAPLGLNAMATPAMIAGTVSAALIFVGSGWRLKYDRTMNLFCQEVFKNVYYWSKVAK